MKARYLVLVSVVIGFNCPQAALAQESDRVTIEQDGTLHIPAQTIPVSEFISPEGQAYLAEHLNAFRNPENFREVDGVPGLIAPYLERQREIFSLTKTSTEFGGVHTVVYEPSEGLPAEQANKVLINLHGGGFSGCWLGCAELESRPVAALGKYRVISVDYRQGPDYKHPAAIEDVAAVYRELLKEYTSENIGIYGCSAGGMLTAMSLAWFQSHDLPTPGAAGILCAGAAPNGIAFGGDANYFATPMGEARMVGPASPDGGDGIAGRGYLSDADPEDPLVAPVTDPEVLANFPPVLIISGTRSYDLSNAVHTHIELTKVDVPAELYIWEGMFHGFFYNPDVPESQESYDVIVRFFNKWLGNP